MALTPATESDHIMNAWHRLYAQMYWMWACAAMYVFELSFAVCNGTLVNLAYAAVFAALFYYELRDQLRLKTLIMNYNATIP